MVVALTGDKESEAVLRRAARIAKRSGAADLLAVHIPARRRARRAPPVGTIARLRRLAEDVGASFHTVVGGEDVPTALLDFARGVNATQLVIGTSRCSRLARTFADIANGNPVPEPQSATSTSGPVESQAGCPVRAGRRCSNSPASTRCRSDRPTTPSATLAERPTPAPSRCSATRSLLDRGRHQAPRSVFNPSTT